MEESKRIAELKELIFDIPIDLNKVEKKIRDKKYTSIELSTAASGFLEECSNDIANVGGLIPDAANVHSPYAYALMELFLQNGMDPNDIVDGYNVMDELRSIESCQIAGNLLRLFLEKGGDPLLSINGECLFDEVDFDVCFGALNQENRVLYESWVHQWLVYLGFGAELVNEKRPLDLFSEDYETEGKPFDTAKLKNHMNYTFGLTHMPERGEKWSLHVFDKRTMWEVIRL